MPIFLDKKMSFQDYNIGGQSGLQKILSKHYLKA